MTQFAIISDTHDNIPNFKKILSWLKKENVRILLHCGDVCSPLTLKECLKEFPGKAYIFLSKIDNDYLGGQEFDNKQIEFYKETGEVNIDNKKIAFCHFPNSARELAESQKYDLVFYGHSHKPWEEKIGKCRLINPGNVAGVFYKATFAVYDTKTEKLELKILEKI